MRLRWLVVILVPYFLLAGCKHVTEGDRQVVDQTEKAGDFIRKKSTQPDVAKAGEDVRDNAAVLKLHLGAPTEPVQPYSPEASGAARERSNEEHKEATDFVQMVLGLVSSHAPWAGPIIGFGWAIYEFFQKRKARQATFSLVKGISTLPSELSNTVDAVKRGDLATKIKAVMEATAKAEGVYRYIDDFIGELRAKKKLEKLA